MSSRTILHSFVNELGNSIVIEATKSEASLSYSIKGPTSTSTNELTIKEGEVLTEVLSSLYQDKPLFDENSSSNEEDFDDEERNWMTT